MIPPSQSVVKGVVGGSVAVSCAYNPKETDSLKYWCRWEETQGGRCPQLVQSKGPVKEQYKGRLALDEEPGNGTYTVILNQLTAQDAGFYWCLTDGDTRWRSMVELKIVEGNCWTGARGKAGSPRYPSGQQQQRPPTTLPPTFPHLHADGESPPAHTCIKHPFPSRSHL